MFHPLFVAIERRFVQFRLFAVLTGGVHLYDAPERVERPFGILVPRAERGWRFTNKTKYGELVFALELYANKFQTLDAEALRLATDALQHAPLEVDGGLVVTMIRPGDVDYEKIEQIWSCSAEFVVQCNQPAAPTRPAP